MSDNKTSRAEALRREILDKIAEYYDIAHQPISFVPGETFVNYGGRVYDERELQNAVARHLALGELASLGPEASQPDPFRASTDFLDDVVAMHLPLQHARQQVVEEFERRYVNDAVERHGGSTAAAATQAGVARRYFRLLRSRYDNKPSRDS